LWVAIDLRHFLWLRGTAIVGPLQQRAQGAALQGPGIGVTILHRQVGGPIEALGSQVFVLAPDGRICCDYQFIEPTPAA